VAAVGTAITQVARWPVWALLVAVPVVAMLTAARLSDSGPRVAATGLVTMTLVGTGAVGYVLLDHQAAGQAVTQRAGRGPAAPPWTLRRWGAGAPRELVAAGRDVWALSGATGLIQIDGTSLNQLGPVRRFGTPVEHVLTCHGHVLVTFGRGRIAEVSPRQPDGTRTVTYGHPVDAGALTGMMTCGAGAVFVALPREAKVLQLALPDLRPVRTIPVGKMVTGLRYSRGVLYVEDASENAVITVNLASGQAWRWIVTMSAPEQIAGLRRGGIIVTHHRSPCLGYVRSGMRQEHGQPWSVQGTVRTIAVGAHHGVVSTTEGLLYRFSAATGRQDAKPIRLTAAASATSAAMTASGRLVLALPGRRSLLAVEPSAWHRVTRGVRRDDGCLSVTG
jgi:hypothetical protein